MQNELSRDISETEHLQGGTLRPEVTIAITRGASRLMQDIGFVVLTEFSLPNGRRADIFGLGPKGEIALIEVKSCREDFMVDCKWESYLDFCDQFYFATRPDFPEGLLPQDEGLVLADRFGAEIVRSAAERKLAAPRRKSLTLRFARQAAQRFALQTTRLQSDVTGVL